MMTERRRAVVLAVLMTAVSLMVVLPREGAAANWRTWPRYEPLMGDPDTPPSITGSFGPGKLQIFILDPRLGRVYVIPSQSKRTGYAGNAVTKEMKQR